VVESPKIDTVEDGFVTHWLKNEQASWTTIGEASVSTPFSDRRPGTTAECLHNEDAAGQQVHNQVAIGNPHVSELLAPRPS